MSNSSSKNKPSPATQRIMIIIFGIFLILYSTYFFLYSGKNITLECFRTAGTNSECKLTEQNLISKTIKPILLASITGARVDSKMVKTKGKTVTESQIILITKTGELPLSSIYSRDTQLIQNNLAKINVFLTYPEQASIIITDDERKTPFIIGAILFICGIIAIISSFFIKG